MLLDYFTHGTEATKTGAKIGCEIETDFVTEEGIPIDAGVTKILLNTTTNRPSWCQQKLELGRQKIELAISSQVSTKLLLEKAYTALEWLYGLARLNGAFPRFEPDITYKNDLLLIVEQRDAIWVELDGQKSLEQLCRCSSVQFTIDVNPADAIDMINSLWLAKLHELDYASNDGRWKAYIKQSTTDYLTDRYGGPEGFENLNHYVTELQRHVVVTHKGQLCHLPIIRVENPDIELFLRSVWWQY